MSVMYEPAVLLTIDMTQSSTAAKLLSPAHFLRPLQLIPVSSGVEVARASKFTDTARRLGGKNDQIVRRVLETSRPYGNPNRVTSCNNKREIKK